MRSNILGESMAGRDDVVGPTWVFGRQDLKEMNPFVKYSAIFGVPASSYNPPSWIKISMQM
jgi:hypothetical protein